MATNTDFLRWLHERLEHIYGEDPRVDYMIKLRRLSEGKPIQARYRIPGELPTKNDADEQDTLLKKQEFLQQYVLNQALVVNNLDGKDAARQALLAWNANIKSTS